MAKWIAVAIGVYFLLGAMVLGLQQQSVSGNVGKVWNAIETGSQKLGQMETQFKFANDQQQAAIKQITTARNNVLALDQAHDPASMEKAFQAFSSTGSVGLALNAVHEAYPDFGLSSALKALLVDTSGVYNRIEYARNQLIDAQVGYNQARVFFIIDGIFFPAQTVLGSTSNPAQDIPGSTLGNQPTVPSLTPSPAHT